MSTTKSAQDILGLEYDWLACDGEGHVALFSTAGGGYAPPESLRDTDAQDAAIEAVLAMAPTTTAVFAPKVGPGCTNTWKLVAERGLYAYDSSPHGDPYELEAMPVELFTSRSCRPPCSRSCAACACRPCDSTPRRSSTSPQS